MQKGEASYENMPCIQKTRSVGQRQMIVAKMCAGLVKTGSYICQYRTAAQFCLLCGIFTNGGIIMSGSDFSKNAAVVSGSVIIVWLSVLKLISSYWTELSGFNAEISISFSWSVTVMIIGGLCIFVADVMLWKDINSKVPLFISAAVTAVMPATANLADKLQWRTLSGYEPYHLYNGFMLSTYSQITKGLPFLFYAAAAVTLTAATVRTFTGTVFPRIASRAAEYAIVIGVVLQPLLSFFILSAESVQWKWTEYISFSVIANCLAGMLVYAAMVMMRRDMCGIVPFLVSSAAAVLLPFISEMLTNFQEMLASCDEDTLYSDEWELYQKYSGYADIFSFVIYIGIVIAAAAAAVQFFSKKEMG